MLNRVLRDFRVRVVEVPGDFPVGLADKLRGIRVLVKPDPFFPEREIKTPTKSGNSPRRCVWQKRDGRGD